MYIEIKEACKNYVQDGKEFTALDHVSLELKRASSYAFSDLQAAAKVRCSMLLRALKRSTAEV